ncbi:MAG TPA: methyltransferase domain-containing protein [bacterium]|nr:methyltransferase domain-containing protein [bacterium]
MSDQIREQQKQTWNKFAPGWKKWDELTMSFLKPAGDAILERARLVPGHRVLDVATGTGEPGLSAAAKVGSGKVTGVDLSEEMAQIARENARSKGLTNFEAKVCDAGILPFDDGIFDAILCRFGVMFFPDPSSNLKEMARVLKPGGRMVLVAWGSPAENTWATTIGQIVNQRLNIPAPPPDAPGLYRFAQEGLLSSLLQSAGLKEVRQEKVQGTFSLESPDLYWDWQTDVAAPVVAALSKADSATREEIKQEVLRLAREKSSTKDKVTFHWGWWVVSGFRA